MSTRESGSTKVSDISRRDFLKLGVAACAAPAIPGLLAGPAEAGTAQAGKPNILYILCDQLRLDAIGAHGCLDVRTPNLDRLIARGVSFTQSYSSNPVCSPARSTLFTGRMPIETGVTRNDRPIAPGIPNLGEWFRAHGYNTAYCGKWHVPNYYALDIAGFTVLPSGNLGMFNDPTVSRACQSWLMNHKADSPFLLVASLEQPHDICCWQPRVTGSLFPKEYPVSALIEQQPILPPNLGVLPKGPAYQRSATMDYTLQQWQYYLYCYNRMVEMLDADVGRILDALEASGHADDTVVVFTSDHGDGGARHSNIQKWFAYDEAMKVPLVISWPGHIGHGRVDNRHLVSGIDLVPTMCDLAGIPRPEHPWGRSLKPLLTGSSVPWRDFLVSEFQTGGRMVHTEEWKYVCVKGDPVTQLFDVKRDPWETHNLAETSGKSDILRDHRRLMEKWESKLAIVDPAYAAM